VACGCLMCCLLLLYRRAINDPREYRVQRAPKTFSIIVVKIVGKHPLHVFNGLFGEHLDFYNIHICA